jgi:hypothetical protein
MLLLNKGILNYNSSNYLSILQNGNTVGWWIADDLTTITKDDNNLIAIWADKINGLQLNIADNGFGASQNPLWTSDGVRFGGLEKTALSTPVFSVMQNLTYYMILKVISINAGYNRWIDGYAGGSDYRPEFYCNGALSATYFIYNGVLEINSGISVDTTKFVIARVIYNAANSYLKIDNAVSPAFNGNGVTTTQLYLGRCWVTSLIASNYIVKEFIARRVVDSSTDETAIYNYLKAKYDL